MIDQHSSMTVTSQEKTDITIDLTNDILIDHSSNHLNKLAIDHHDVHDHLQHLTHDHVIDQPLLKWSKEVGKFVVYKHTNNDDSMNASSSSIEMQSTNVDIRNNQHSLIDMFDNEKSQSTKTNSPKLTEKLFDGYITFYQRVCLFSQKNLIKLIFFKFEQYLDKINRKDEQQQTQLSTSSSITTA